LEASLPPNVIPTPREGPSPFIHGTSIQFAWDSTCLGALKKCPRFYQLQIIEGWRPKDTSVHLTFGILYTEALEYYDLLRAEDFNHEQALDSVVNQVLEKTWVPESEGVRAHRWEHGPYDSKIGNKNFYNLIRSVIWYLEQYKDDPCKVVIAEDGTPLVERSFRMELDFGPLVDNKIRYIICGHLDKVVDFVGSRFTMDHKTTKTTISDYYFDQYHPNNQMSLYTIAGKVIFDSEIKGVIIDAAQIAVGFTRFERGLTYRSEAQIQEWLNDLCIWLQHAESYAIHNYWPQNDVACFNCDFNKGQSKICAKDPSVRQMFLESHFTQEDPWNPLKVRN